MTGAHNLEWGEGDSTRVERMAAPPRRVLQRVLIRVDVDVDVRLTLLGCCCFSPRASPRVGVGVRARTHEHPQSGEERASEAAA